MAFRNTDLLLDNEKHPHQTLNFYTPNEIDCKLLKTKGEKKFDLYCSDFYAKLKVLLKIRNGNIKY